MNAKNIHLGLVCLLIGCGTQSVCAYDSILPKAKEDYDRLRQTVEKLKDAPDQTIAKYKCESDWLDPNYKRVRFNYTVTLTVRDALKCIADVTAKIRYEYAPEPNGVAMCLWDLANNLSRKMTVGQASGGSVSDPSWWERFKPYNSIAEGPDCGHGDQEWIVIREPAKSTTNEFVAATIWFAGQLVELVEMAPSPTLFVVKPGTPPEEACYDTPTAAPKRCAANGGCPEPDQPPGAEPPSTGGVMLPPGTTPGDGSGASGGAGSGDFQ